MNKLAEQFQNDVVTRYQEKLAALPIADSGTLNKVLNRGILNRVKGFLKHSKPIESKAMDYMVPGKSSYVNTDGLNSSISFLRTPDILNNSKIFSPSTKKLFGGMSNIHLPEGFNTDSFAIRSGDMPMSSLISPSMKNIGINPYAPPVVSADSGVVTGMIPGVDYEGVANSGALQKLLSVLTTNII